MKSEPEFTIDEETSETNQHGTPIRVIRKVTLHAVSLVRDPRQQHTLRDEYRRLDVQRDPRQHGPQ